MNGTSHLTSVLLDKGTVREALRAVVRAEMGLTLPPRQQTAYTAIQALLVDGTRLYITPQLLHILHRPANLPIASILLPELSPLSAGRYLRRWARRLREAGISREDALVVSYASFGVDEPMETFGIAIVLTTDTTEIPHGGPDLGEFLSVKPYISLSQELQQVLVLFGQIEYQQPLLRDV